MIDEALIDSEEDGFHLVVTGDLAEECEAYLDDVRASGLRLRLSQDAAIQLLAQCRDVIGPWDAERQEAWRSFRTSALSSPDWDDADAYDPSDPKSPGWSERVADAADLARKRAKGDV